jgi:peptide/nickel transport system permease protein
MIQAISIAAGLSIGIAAGYSKGVLDGTVSYINNILLSIPSPLAAVCMVAVFGSSAQTIVITIALIESVTYARLARSRAISIRECDFAMGAAASGGSAPYVLCRHILPNVFIPMIPLVAMMIGRTIVIISGLSFLGIGVQPPTPEIGTMLKEALSFMARAPWLMLYPGLTLCGFSLLFNVAGDMLTDYFDPHYYAKGKGE